jgi:hypothetical protein
MRCCNAAGGRVMKDLGALLRFSTMWPAVVCGALLKCPTTHRCGKNVLRRPCQSSRVVVTNLPERGWDGAKRGKSGDSDGSAAADRPVVAVDNQSRQ